jgi:hypothetical protein
MAMIVWHMVTVDENVDLGIFGSAQKAMDYYDALDDIPTTWGQGTDHTWYGSVDGEVEVTITRRPVV